MELAGAVVLVTGATRGIGLALTTELTARGAHVVAAGRTAADVPGAALSVVADVREPGAAQDLVSAAVDRFGRLDAVVANAGLGHAGPVADMTADRIDDLVVTNLLAPIQLCRAALPALIEAASSRPGAAVVLMGSIAGLLGVPGESVYSATKAGLETFGVTLREEVCDAGVTVTTVAPGVVDTGLLRGRGEAYARRFPRPMPAARLATRVVRAMEQGAERVVEPRWLTVADRVHALAPGTYRRLSRRFG